MYLVYVQVARPFTTQNKEASLKTLKKNGIWTLVDGLARRNA